MLKQIDVTEAMKEDVILFNENMKSDKIDINGLRLSGTMEEIMTLIYKVFDVIE